MGLEERRLGVYTSGIVLLVAEPFQSDLIVLADMNAIDP